MAHIVSVIGHTLRDMLLADGWTPEWERNGHCHMRSPTGKHRGFPLNALIPVHLVKSIADTAAWSAERFEELRTLAIPSSDIKAGTVIAKPPTRLQ